MNKILKGLKLLMFYWRPFKWRILMLGLLNVFVSFIQGVGVLMLIPLLNFVLKNPSNDNNAVLKVFSYIQDYTGVESSLELILLLYLVLFSLTTLINYFNGIEQAKFQQEFMKSLRNKLFNSFIRSPWKMLKKESFSGFSQFLTVEVMNISSFNYSVVSIFSSSIVLAVHVAIAFYISAVFSAFLIVAVGIILLVTKKAFKDSYVTGMRNFEKNNILIKGIENIKSVFKYSKLHSNEDWIAGRFEDANTGFAKGMVKVVRISLLSQNIMYMLGMCLLIGVVYFSVKTEFISHESIFLLIVVFSRIYPKVNMIFRQTVNTSSLVTSVMKYRDKMNELDAVDSESNAKCIGKLDFNKDIRLENIGLKFGDRSLYEDFNIRIEKNKVFGIYGASGSGKTSLLDIIAGLHMEYSGKMLVDGIKLDDDNVGYWKNNIAVVPQDTNFIEGSVRENLLFGENVSSDDFVFDVLKRCRIYDAVMSLPGGLDSDVQNIEYVLSGGEKKRFGLARALLRNADVLLLDEPTSGLDPDTETEIMDMIKSLTSDYTVIIVSHSEKLKSYTDDIVAIGDSEQKYPCMSLQ